MGIDPKPKKSRKQTATHLPMRPRTPSPSTTHGSDGPPLQGSALQTRIPSGPGTDVEVNLPAVHNLLEQIVGVHNDGYFKLSLGDEGKTWYLAYKWQHGPHAGSYVMARVHRGEISLAAILLAEKVLAVRAGLRKPTVDRYQG